MRPFGSLPRPRSRFKRPLSSWIWRVVAAGKLRLGFTLVYLVVAGAAFAKLYGVARDSGYFYPVSERQALWRKFPDEAALSTLESIYGDKSNLPEMRLIRQIHQPLSSQPGFDELLKDPQWSTQAKIAQTANFDARLTDLEQVPYYYRFEELLAASDNGRLLDPKQRQRLDIRRRDEVEWFVNEAQPESEARARAFRFRMWGYYTRPWPLDAEWSSNTRLMARQHQRELVARLVKNVNLADLRRLQLEVKFAGLVPELSGQLMKLAERTRDQHPSGISDDQLVVIAHFKKLLPTLDLRALTAGLTPKQREVLDCMRELTANP